MSDATGRVEKLRRELEQAKRRIAELEHQPRERGERLHRYNAVLTDLSRSAEIRRGDLESCFRLATETAAQTLAVERVSVWLFNDDRRSLICRDLFEWSADRHSSGLELEAQRYPRYFAALERGRAIAAAEACTDPDTSEFREDYLEPLGIRSMLDSPIRGGGHLLGVVCHEHTGATRTWSAEETQFAASVADFVSLAYEFFLERRTRQLELGKSEALRLLATGHALDEVMESLTVTVERQIVDLWCSVLVLDDEQRLRKCAAPSLPRSYVEAIDGLAIGPDAGVCGTATYRRERIVVADVETHPLCRSWRAVAREYGLRSCWSQPILSSTGEALGAFAMYSATVREPSAYELDIIESAAHLAGIAIQRRRGDERMRRLELALEHAMSGIVRFDSQGRFAYINESGAERFGYRQDELVGKPWTGAVEPADHRAFEAAYRRVADEGRAEVEFRALRRDGSSFHCRALIVAPESTDSAGGPACFLQDITAGKIAEKERRQLQEQLRHSQKMEAIGQLAGGVAHDFNNLLTAILGNTEMLLDAVRDVPQPEGEDSAESALREIQRAGERAAELTRQLLAFGRKQVRRVRSIDPNAVVSEAQGMLSRLLGEKIEVETHLTPGLPRIRADLSQLNQVLINLAVNARDAMPGGGRLALQTEAIPAGGVELHPPLAGPLVMIKVSDTGIGMDRETLKRIFEPFFTTKPLGRGTGLGLATVYGIVAQSGGRILVDSDPGRGTTFTVLFPVAQGDEPEPEPEEQELEREATAVREETVLLCEDDELVRSVSETALQSAGYRVLTAALPDEALELFRQHGDSVDMLLTDTVMPGMNGPGLARELLSRKPGLKVLFVSGYTSGAAEAEDFGGETEFLQKPYNITTLLSRVRHILEA